MCPSPSSRGCSSPPPSPLLQRPQPPPHSHTHHQGEQRVQREVRVRKSHIEAAFSSAAPLIMARNLPLYDQLVEEDYIDMDISSATFLCYSISSPPHPREFEFQMSGKSLAEESLPSPADELFYKGKLLPLHLPPRLQVIQNLLLQNPNPNPRGEGEAPLNDNTITTATTTAATTPFESCNVSPTTSCYVSRELNPEDYYYECTDEIIQSNPKKSWSKKLKSIRQSSLGLKLKASKAYLRSLFTKPGCSDESCAVSKAKENSKGLMKKGKKNLFGQIQREKDVTMHTSASATKRREKMTEEEEYEHRRSFSGAIKWHSSNKSSSTSSSCSSSNSSSFSSVNSNSLYSPQMLRRSSSANSEVESSIQGAIAYCKKSQQLFCARKSVSDVGFCSLAASKIVSECEKQERPGLCRG